MKAEDKSYDVIVIGGGPAGSTTATTLAQKGHRVLLLEKAKFPREHIGESLLPFCYQIFEELGVLDKMEARFTRKPGVTFSNFDGSDQSHWCFAHVIDDPSHLSFHVRRAFFDDMLLRNSESKGVRVEEEMGVQRVEFGDDGKGVSVVATDADGERKIFEARYVVDASGQATLLAKQFSSKKPFERLKPRAAISSHWLKVNLNEDLEEGNIKIVHLEGEKLGWIWMIPIKGRLSIGVAANMTYVNARRRELSKTSDNWQEEFYMEELQSSPVVARIIEGAHMAQPVAVNGDFSYFAEQKYGDRFAIVGDAAGFLDPIFSSGVYLGMKGGQRVAEGISEQLNGNGAAVLKEAYKDVDGAYRLVEELVSTFYEPGSVRFSGADKVLQDQSYKKFETAYSILHLVLAGDFFNNHQKYLKAIELLRDKTMIDKYRNLISHPPTEKDDIICRRKEELVSTPA